MKVINPIPKAVRDEIKKKKPKTINDKLEELEARIEALENA